jgi:hypothetical protein
MRANVALASLSLIFLAGAPGCERTLTGSPEPVRTIAASLTESSACSSVSGTLLLRFVGSDGTHLFFDGDIQGDLEGTLSETIEVVPPTASLPTVIHVSGSSQWTISGGSIPELIGRVVVFSVTGIGVDAGALGHAFHSTVVAGARSGDIVQQEPRPDFFPYHGAICP